jgi:hypothetical protein
MASKNTSNKNQKESVDELITRIAELSLLHKTSLLYSYGVK